MNDEQSLMEEKSILACVPRVVGHNPTTSTNYGLSSFSKAEIPAYEWLSDELRNKIIQSCEHVPTRQGYPVVDWLKQIRSNCDFCETGTMSQTTINVTTKSNINNFYLNFSGSGDNVNDTDVDDESSNYNEEMNVPDCELNPNGNPENELMGISPCKREGEENNINIKNEEVGFSCCLDDVADSDSENFDNSSNMSESMPDGQFPDTSSHSWSFSELTMYPRRVVCCVNLIRDESGYFTCQTSSFEDLPELKLVMENDDTDALMVCQKFLDETIVSKIDSPRNDLSGSTSTIPGSCDIGFYEAGYHFVEENTDLHTRGSSSSSSSSEPIVMDCENNLSLSNVNVKVNVTFPRFADAAAAGNVRWTQTFNDFDSHDSINDKSINNNSYNNKNNNNNIIYNYDCEFVSNEHLYKSCDNLDTDNTRMSKMGDSDYKSIGSGSSYLQEFPRDGDQEVEEYTSFDDKFVQSVIHENWNTCLTSECSSQSLEDTRTSEFYSPIEFNETAFDEAAGINTFCDYDDDDDDDDDSSEDVDKFRQRKGSTSSDVLMWKKNLLFFNMDDEDDMRQVQKR